MGYGLARQKWPLRGEQPVSHAQSSMMSIVTLTSGVRPTQLGQVDLGDLNRPIGRGQPGFHRLAPHGGRCLPPIPIITGRKAPRLINRSWLASIALPAAEIPNRYVADYVQ